MARRNESSYDLAERKKEGKLAAGYKWVALSNTTLGALMAAIDSSILIISLPAIFDGLGVNPLMSGDTSFLLWLLLGYTIVAAVTVVTVGRLSDMFGRVKLYNVGFLIFAIASTLLYVSSYLITGPDGALALVVLRLFQGLGGGFLMANGAAILTDAFPENQRGMALGINQISAIVGSLIGLLVGGVLASVDWHLVFLISVPVGIAGAVWSYLALHEIASINRKQKLDILGNLTFAASILMILMSLIYGVQPYAGNAMGWSDPFVITGLVGGVILLLAFVYIEIKAENPMLDLAIFRIRTVAFGMLALLLAGIARGGLQFMLVIWLQGIWLPLHGVSFTNTPLQAGIDMMPLILGFLVAGPLSGYLSDKYGARPFSTAGMLINTVGFLLLATLPYNFNFAYFAILIFVTGVGQGMFAAPNTASIMSAVPAEHRGATSGMRATLFNLASIFSIAIFFTILAIGVSTTLPAALYGGLIAQNVSALAALQISHLPPTAALFAALLGYNPMKTLLPQSVISSLPQQNVQVILGNTFFPSMIANSFMEGMRIVLYVGAAMTLIAAIACALRGKREVAKL